MVIQVKCGTEMRRQVVKDSRDVNGIDYLEVFSSTMSPDSVYRQLLVVHCFKSKGLSDIQRDNVAIEGGVRRKGIIAEWVQCAKNIVNDLTARNINQVTEDLTEDEKNIIKDIEVTVSDHVLVIRPSNSGDFSTYILRLVHNLQSELPLQNFDVILSKIEFSFKAGCLADFDCAAENVCPTKDIREPLIDYQAKDFASFRRLILDHISTIMPGMKERNPASLEIVSIELLAYLGDHLSYSQDAIATEAYLGTARKRVSIKRHARFLDYFLHDGCNARAWICIEMASDVSEFVIKKNTKLLTRGTDDDFDSDNIVIPSNKFEEAIARGDEAFETMHDLTIYNSHNEISFYTWGESQCCLPKGATSATIRNDGNKYDVLLFTWEKITSSTPPDHIDAERLKKFLSEDIDLQWVVADKPEMKFNLISEGLIELSNATNFLYIILNDKKTQVIVSNDKEGNSRIYEFVARREDGKLNVYTLSLKVRDVLLFEEISSPTTYKPEDADSTHRHFVRLSQVTRSFDELFGIPLIEIAWKPQDALPFPLCIEVVVHSKDEDKPRKTISIARGNVVLADHGYRLIKSIDPTLIENQNLLSVEGEENYGPYAYDGESATTDTHDRLDSKVEATEFLGYAPSVIIGKRKFRPRLSRKPLTFMGPFDQSLPASAALVYNVHEAHPDITLTGEGKIWLPLPDLLQSREFDNNFVVEIENDGTASVRFANFDAGTSADFVAADGSPFYATYRVGNGIRGNVGAESVTRIVLDGEESSLITRVRNPIPFIGGTEPEDIELVRQYAPEAFRIQERAVTPSDYVEILKRHPEVQKAFATFRWTGSWYTVFIAVDRFDRKIVDLDFKNNIRDYLNHYRLAGYDLEVKEPIYVPLYIQINICVKPSYFPGNIEKKLLEVFSSGNNPDGSRGFFHPDNLTFGQPVLLSKIYEAAMSVDGASSCSVEFFQRWGKTPNDEIEKGMIEMGYYEIARLDNDPNFPENGKIEFAIQ